MSFKHQKLNKFLRTKLSVSESDSHSAIYSITMFFKLNIFCILFNRFGCDTRLWPPNIFKAYEVFIFAVNRYCLYNFLPSSFQSSNADTSYKEKYELELIAQYSQQSLSWFSLFIHKTLAKFVPNLNQIFEVKYKYLPSPHSNFRISYHGKKKTHTHTLGNAWEGINILTRMWN